MIKPDSAAAGRSEVPHGRLGALSQSDIEGEVDRFFEGLLSRSLVAEESSVSGRRRLRAESCDSPAAARRTSADVIYRRALEILDAEGLQALNARRLAAELRISTRTLYKQIGNRDKLIRTIVHLHFSQIRLGLREYASWETTASNWCLLLHDTLLAHPHLTELMTDEDAHFLLHDAAQLVTMTLQLGVPEEVAIGCCRSLINLTVADAIIEARGALVEPIPPQRTTGSPVERNFPETVRWILAGVRAVSHANSPADLS